MRRPGARLMWVAAAVGVWAAAVAGLEAPAAYADDTVQVPCDGKALQTAVKKVRQTPTTLNLAKDCTYKLPTTDRNGYTGLGVGAGKTITFVGNGATLQVLPSRIGMSYGFRVSGVLTLKDLTVTGATYGAFKVTRSDYGSKGELYLETVRVTGNRSSDGAAGIWLQSGTTLVARDSTIAHNVSGPTTSAGGAALEIAERSVSQGPASATLYNTTVANNSASGEKDRGAEVSGGGNGGGIRNKGNLTLDGSSRVTGNTSRASESGKGGEGGGIYNTGTLTIKGGSSVTGNTAQPYKTGSRSGQVGGIFNSGTVTLSDDSRIDGNTPQNCGGPTPIPACAS